MSNRIVSEKEFRSTFRAEAVAMCDFSQKKQKHVLGIGARQVSVSVGAEIVKALVARFQADGRTLDKDMVHLLTPKGARAYASLQFNQIGKMRLVHGANAIETVWKSLGDLIPVARKGVTNIYVAKNGATDMELAAMRDLRTGKLNARMLANEQLVEAIDEARAVLDGRNLGEMYAASCTEYFHTLPLDAAE